MNEAVKESILLRGLYNEFISDHEDISTFYANQSALHLTKHQMFHGKTKHIDIKYHFIQDIIVEGKLFVRKIGISNNPVDMLIKSLHVAKFWNFLNLISIQCT